MCMKDTNVTTFLEDINNGPFKEYKRGIVLTSKTEEKVYYAAIYQGYLDACRTFTNKQKKLEKSDDSTISELAGAIKKYLNNSDSKFNHKKLCDILCNGSGMSYGQAQKIVNMAFKYLYCLVGKGTPENMKPKFDACHMPLDGVMLEWICRNVKPESGEKILKSKIPSWSSMEYGNDSNEEEKYTYSYFQKVLTKYCSDNGKTQLQLDFENWKAMQLILAAEDFIKAFSPESSIKAGKDNKSLNELITNVENICKSYKEKED